VRLAVELRRSLWPGVEDESDWRRVESAGQGGTKLNLDQNQGAQEREEHCDRGTMVLSLRSWYARRVLQRLFFWDGGSNVYLGA